MTSEISTLASLGWSHVFSRQLDLDEISDRLPVRVTEVHRNALRVRHPDLDRSIPPYHGDPQDEEAAATVGDWLLLDAESLRPIRLLERRNLFKRRQPGTGRGVQLIAANVDTLFILSSCNLDFNPARLKRFLALARTNEVQPVIVLSKADLADNPEDYVAAASALGAGLLVEVMDVRDPDQVRRLDPWLGEGQTVAMVGSSGVGKSTLANTLLGAEIIRTSGIRADDDKGRHTTSARKLHRLPAGGWLLDSPGLRELGLVDAQAGLDAVFSDITAWAENCRFGDCRHEDEPGCAVRDAVERGLLDAAHLRQWKKLIRENQFNTETLAERRHRDRKFGKMVKRVVQDKARERDG